MCSFLHNFEFKLGRTGDVVNFDGVTNQTAGSSTESARPHGHLFGFSVISSSAGWPTPHLFGFFRFFLKLQNFRGTDLKLLIFRAYSIKITESTTDSVIF